MITKKIIKDLLNSQRLYRIMINEIEYVSDGYLMIPFSELECRPDNLIDSRSICKIQRFKRHELNTDVKIKINNLTMLSDLHGGNIWFYASKYDSLFKGRKVIHTDEDNKSLISYRNDLGVIEFAIPQHDLYKFHVTETISLLKRYLTLADKQDILDKELLNGN